MTRMFRCVVYIAIKDLPEDEVQAMKEEEGENSCFGCADLGYEHVTDMFNILIQNTEVWAGTGAAVVVTEVDVANTKEIV